MINDYRPLTTATVRAVQWTDENVKDVQALLAPASPLWIPGQRSIGVMIGTGVHAQLYYAQVEDWIVRTGETIAILGPVEFAKRYTPVAGHADAVLDAFRREDSPTETLKDA